MSRGRIAAIVARLVAIAMLSGMLSAWRVRHPDEAGTAPAGDRVGYQAGPAGLV